MNQSFPNGVRGRKSENFLIMNYEEPIPIANVILSLCSDFK